MIYLSAYTFESLVDGTGVRTVLFFSGCRHNCKGCHSPQTHNFNNGQLLDDNLIDYLNENMKKRPFLSGITFSGGDPMYVAEELIKILPKLYIPKDNIWIYSGFTYNNIIQNTIMNELLNKCDYLVDGEFDIDKRDITHKCMYRGSSNQNIYKKIENNNWIKVSK